MLIPANGGYTIIEDISSKSRKFYSKSPQTINTSMTNRF